MKRVDIDNSFTEKVREYIEKGYVIHTASMIGSNGNSRVDMLKGNDFVRIFKRDFHRNCDIEAVCVARKTLSEKEKYDYNVWQEDLEVIETTNFYCVQKNKWYVTLSEYHEIAKKREERFERKMYREMPIILPNQNKAKEIVLPFLQRQKGCKSLKLADITSVRKTVYEGQIQFYVYVSKKSCSYILQ